MRRDFVLVFGLTFLAVLAACAPASLPTATVLPAATGTPFPTPAPSPSPTSAVDLFPSLPAELAAQFDPNSYTVVQNADGVWVARNNADGLDLMTYDSGAKEWQLPELFSGLAETSADVPKIAAADGLMALIIQQDLKTAIKEGFASDAPVAEIWDSPGNKFTIHCDAGVSACMEFMHNFSRDVQTNDGKTVTQYFVTVKIHVPVTDKTPEGVVVGAFPIGETGYSDDPYATHSFDRLSDWIRAIGLRPEIVVMAGQSADSEGMSLEDWFGDPQYMAEINAMKQALQIWNINQPFASFFAGSHDRP
jgi:hypothetical protein